jgi:hypothetical protein
MYWPGAPASPFLELPDWPATTICKALVAHRYHLFALDIDGPGGTFPMQLLWSDAAEPGAVPASWTPAADNEAGSADLSDTPGPLLTAQSLRGSLLIYKRSATYAADYVGGNQVYDVRPLFTSSGALTRHAVADVNGQHFVVCDGDIILTDGTSRRSVAQGRMRDFVFQQIDMTNYEALFVLYNRAKNEVWVCFPEAGETLCTLAAVYDLSGDTWAARSLPSVSCAAIGVVNDVAESEAWDADAESWDDDLSLWNQQNFNLATEALILGEPTTPAMIQVETADAVAVQATLGKYDMTFGEPERVKFAKRLHVRALAGYGTLFVRAGARMTPSGSITWSNEVTLTEPEQIVNLFAQGRYISVEIRSQGVELWRISGFDIEAEVRGYH